MSQDVRVDEEQITQRRAQVLGINYIDTTTIQKQLFKNVLTVQELYDIRVIPLVADEHYIHFGITTRSAA
jgi:enterochelin esterase-like enzyme